MAVALERWKDHDMSDEKLKLSQIAALLVLMGEAREVSNTELAKTYVGYTLTGEDRKKLNDLKLVESWKQGRTFVHVLTDDGWARVIKELARGIERPERLPGVALHAALSAMLGGVQRFMDRTGHALADIFAPVDSPLPSEFPAPPAEPVESPARPTEQAEPTPSDEQATPLTGADIEARIRAAYAELARKPGTWVGLAEVRSLLRDVPRVDVDGTLRRLSLIEGVELIPESNQKTLTQQDRDAAVTIGDQDKHLLWIRA
jgi:hypothetical protein